MQEVGEGMAIKHIVLFKLNDEIKDSEIQEKLDETKRLLEVIPGVSDLLIGPNLHPWSEENTYGVCLTLEDKAAYDAYAEHPNHNESIEIFRPYSLELRVLHLEM